LTGKKNNDVAIIDFEKNVSRYLKLKMISFLSSPSNSHKNSKHNKKHSLLEESKEH